ncbi:MAG: hypothetical protein COT90_03715 [Candidatus Diapherotrites archaeon CG10_big_fil_rev_8_21_14_0_10_31_34]|nr:MAG: hypothetical protein COT90_03715 [Candidatus Diapherotrites archaeon CG10_big_fil_rev_8_21_14_0_10_31_34]
MDDNKRKQDLINKMLEAKRIEITNNQRNVIFKITNLFSKPKKPLEERITALKKSLEKKDAEELEYMILQKEGSLLLLEKRVNIQEEKNKLKEIIDELNELKKNEGKREKIAREVGFKKKEIKELKKEVESKVVIDKPEEADEKIKPKQPLNLLKKTLSKQPFSKSTLGKKVEQKGKEKTAKTKSEKRRVKSRKTKQKKKFLKETQEKKDSKKIKEIKTEKKEIKFISPLDELKQKREKEISSKRQKALDAFHNEFTSGKETYVSIKGGARIIAGKQPVGTPAQATATHFSSAKTFQGKTDEQFDFDIAKVQQKMKNLKYAFFHRQISEQDYKKKLFDYQEELSSLEMEKKRPKSFTPVYGPATDSTASSVIKIKKGKKGRTTVFDSGLKTIQQESIKFATQHTPKSRQKVREALKEFSQDFDSNPYFAEKETKNPVPGKPESIEPRKTTMTGIIKRIAPTVDPKKTTEMENKLADLMQRKNIGETQIRRELEFVSAKELINKFDKILSSIEQKYEPKESQKIAEDTGFNETSVIIQKKTEKREGEIKEIHAKKIVTDFDKLLKLIKEKGKVNEKDAARELGMSTERIKECYLVLEKNDLVKLNFPVFGGAQLISKEYIKPEKKKKAKKKKGVK